MLMEKYHYNNLADKEECGFICSLKIRKDTIDIYGKEIFDCFRVKYNSIKQRCDDKNADNYKYYGGKGILCEYISFADFFYSEFKKFLKGYEKYGKNVSPDRINVFENYSESNVRWIDFAKQAQNKENTKIIIGISPENKRYEFVSIREFSKIHNIDRRYISKCLKKEIDEYKKWSFYYL